MTNINKENKINSLDLLSPNRLDVVFKYAYLKYKKSMPEFARRIYKEHIYAITNGTYKEGKTSKDSILKFISAFDDIFNSIKKNNFNSKISKIPITINNTISNGAHRLASSIFLKKDVYTLLVDDNDSSYDYNFFIQRGVDIEILEFIILEYLLLKKDIYIALIWPSANKKIEYKSSFNNIIYQKSFKLNPKGAHNFLAQIYKEQNWIGSFDNGYGGTYLKLNQAFKNFSPIKAIFFHESSIENVNKIKKQLRDKFQIGKASIHITDNKDETVEIAKYILNKNSLHFLNNSKPYKYKHTYNNLEEFKNELKNNNINLSNILIDGGTALAIYGIRASNDLDYLINNNFEYKSSADNHINQIKYHKQTLNNLIYNPKFYFYFNDFKFISLKQLKQMKKNRASSKDLLDIKLINSGNNFQLNLFKNLNQLYMIRFKIVALLIPITKKIGLYNFSKYIYKKIFKA